MAMVPNAWRCPSSSDKGDLTVRRLAPYLQGTDGTKYRPSGERVTDSGWFTALRFLQKPILNPPTAQAFSNHGSSRFSCNAFPCRDAWFMPLDFTRDSVCLRNPLYFEQSMESIVEQD